ncbi:uroporphyrinogen-III C-methyltransferase [Lutimonas sp.]|uniref:uroporphyrinogen-III C-methyltransferase n=1 Tax=Lutimonas sp. TaxID=1872403 RepID=UPI003D9B8BDE
MKPRPQLTLVGAGPGDPDLITVKGLKALQSADVVLYDALVNPVLLEHANQAKKIFVGKRKGFHRYTQDEINQKIVENALEYGHVLRLKGGDPFVFGRGSEETDYAEKYGIPTCIVPGISSSSAVPSSIGIPLTKRGVSESFWVITGCTSSRQLSLDVGLAAQSSATIVILMGMNKLHEIVGIFQELGKDQLAAAVIQNGTMPTQRSVVGQVHSIEALVDKHELSSPAIIIFGDVVNSATELQKKVEEVTFEYAS